MTERIDCIENELLNLLLVKVFYNFHEQIFRLVPRPGWGWEQTGGPWGRVEDVTLTDSPGNDSALTSLMALTTTQVHLGNYIRTYLCFVSDILVLSLLRFHYMLKVQYIVYVE